jgi:hypothetical protein
MVKIIFDSGNGKCHEMQARPKLQNIKLKSNLRLCVCNEFRKKELKLILISREVLQFFPWLRKQLHVKKYQLPCG